MEMLNFYYLGETSTQYPVEFSLSGNVATVKGILPAKVKGFFLTRPGMNDAWDYTAFTTIYRVGDDFVQFSNDGSKYEEPTTDVNVSISWNDEDDKEKFRPSKLLVELFADGEKIDQFVLNATNGWQKSYKYMPTKKYEIDVADVPEYEKNISGTNATYTHTIIPPLKPTIEEQLNELLEVVCMLDERVYALEQIIYENN